MTTENPTLDLIDLFSREDRLMIADHFEEQGDARTAAILRSHDQPYVYDGKVYGLYSTCDAIRNELERLGCDDIEVGSDDDFPLGWVRVSDGNSASCGHAREILQTLREVTGEDDSRGAWETTWDATWEALSIFTDQIRADRDYQFWMGNHKFGKTTPDGKWATIACACNEGWCWRYYPNDNDWLSDNHNLGWSDWYASEEEALAAAALERSE